MAVSFKDQTNRCSNLENIGKAIRNRTQRRIINQCWQRKINMNIWLQKIWLTENAAIVSVHFQDQACFPDDLWNWKETL